MSSLKYNTRVNWPLNLQGKRPESGGKTRTGQHVANIDITYNYPANVKEDTVRQCVHAAGVRANPSSKPSRSYEALSKYHYPARMANQTRYLSRSPAEYSRNGSPMAFTFAQIRGNKRLGPRHTLLRNRLTLGSLLSSVDRSSIFADFL